MSKYGIKISQPNYDVSSTGNENLALTSELNSFKVFITGTSAFTDGDTITITHDLGYIPGYLVYYDVTGTDKRFLADISNLTEALGVTTYTRMFTDRLEITFDGGTAETGNLRYFIFSDILV